MRNLLYNPPTTVTNNFDSNIECNLRELNINLASVSIEKKCVNFYLYIL